MFEYTVICLIVALIFLRRHAGMFDYVFLVVMCLTFTPIVGIVIYRYIMRQK